MGVSCGGEGLTQGCKLAQGYIGCKEFPAGPLVSTTEDSWCGSLPKVLLVRVAILDSGELLVKAEVCLVLWGSNCDTPSLDKEKEGNVSPFPGNKERSPLWWQLF